MRYEKGETVVHPQHGTVTVVGAARRDVGRGPEDYLELYVESRSLKIMVPAAALDAVGIRNLASRGQAEEILAILEQPSEVSDVWAERNVFTVARVKSRDLDQASMVIRDLSRLQHRAAKPLTLGERNALDACLDLVARELSLALGLSEQETRSLLVEKSLNESACTN